MFSHRQLSELITAIKGRSEIPLKFSYITKKGTKVWDRIAKLRGVNPRGINSVESNLLSAKADAFLSSFKNLKKLNIIDIGPGNASPVMLLLNRLNDMGVEFRYVPVDISMEMLNLAEKNVRKAFPNIPIKKVQLDFELGNFPEITYDLRKNGYQNFMLFLGSTLGNQSDRNRVLTNFRDSMTSDDYLAIGVELVNLYKIDKLLLQYDVPEVKAMGFATAEYLGLKQSDGEFEIKFDTERHQVEVDFRMLKNRRLKIAEENIVLEKDDRLLLFISHKFTEWLFAKVLAEVGFRIELLTTSSEKGYSLAMCQPSRFTY
jgi:uncharacterized SAM-dependent methyltransferase